MTWVIDAILAAVLVGLVWLGAKRGLMKSLAGVISVGAAFFGASWCQPLRDAGEPVAGAAAAGEHPAEVVRSGRADAGSCCRLSPLIPTVWRRSWRMWRSG